ncbi:MAG: RNA polymerase sigma factor [Planctomycetota bacterium]|jgi:RNA polymerase sigma-70 factor (ECF subfamily)
MDELSLVRASQRGDKAAFGSLIDLYYRNIYRLAYQYTGSHQDAADICQDTFLRAFDSIRKLRDAKRFKGWIFMIALNLLRRRAKEIRSRMQLAVKTVDSVAVKLTEYDNVEPCETLSAKEKAAIIHKQLQIMPEHMRLVTVLTLMEGLTQKDTAGVLNCSEASVSRWLDMARQWLSTRLQNLI